MQIKILTTVAIATLLLGLLTTPTACYYDTEEELYGTACDTVAVTFGDFVQPLINNNCTGCHNASGVQSNAPLTTYAEIKVYVENGFLHARTNDATNPMPQSGLLPLCDRQKLKAWIDAGALDN